MGVQYEHPFPTARLVEGRLVPLPEAVAANTVVWVALPDDGGSGQSWEGLAAERTAGSRARLRAVPLFAHNFNYDDEVFLVPSAEGPPLIVATPLKWNGNQTFRIWLDDDNGAVLSEAIAQFGRLGCLVEEYDERLLGLSCGLVQAPVVENALRQAEAEGRFYYERGSR